ncbi:MAG: hypothetical protein KDD11_08815 [Acidobacteria bacterium]|nr:hypothetical protein [Acidobacteriota bacterium]
MDTWSKAARHYSSLDEQGREDYWQQLTAEQQLALKEALADRQQMRTACAQSVGTIPKERVGALGTVVIGVAGFFLGIFLTVIVQIVAVRSGLEATQDYIDRKAWEEEAAQLQCNPPRSAEEKQRCDTKFLQEMQQDLNRRRGR